jgi:hypothetical protein
VRSVRRDLLHHHLLAVQFDGAHPVMETVTIPESAAAAVRVRRHPRDELDLPERDYEVLRYVMEGYQETQGNVDLALFPGHSKTPVSRSVNRLVAAGYLIVERWNRVGVNLLRGTACGRARLIERGIDPSTLFVPEKPVAAKDLAHHTWINEARLALQQHGLADVKPCWAVRRMMAALHPPAIPDLLGFQTAADGSTAGVLAVEIDLGSEPLKNVFFPKLDLLREMLTTQAAGQPAAILVLTVGPRRILAMEAGIADRLHRIPIVVMALPKASGRASVAELASLFCQAAS